MIIVALVTARDSLNVSVTTRDSLNVSVTARDSLNISVTAREKVLMFPYLRGTKSRDSVFKLQPFWREKESGSREIEPRPFCLPTWRITAGPNWLTLQWLQACRFIGLKARADSVNFPFSVFTCWQSQWRKTVWQNTHPSFGISCGQTADKQ